MGDYADDLIEQGMYYTGAFGRRGPRPKTPDFPPAPKGSELARARARAHSAFDTKWKSGSMTRTEAYEWLAKQLGLSKHKCHILQFDIEMCNRVAKICTIDDFDVLE